MNAVNLINYYQVEALEMLERHFHTNKKLDFSKLPGRDLNPD